MRQGQPGDRTPLAGIDWARLIDQRGRMLQLESALPSLALIPECIVVREAINELFEWTLDCISTDAFIDLTRLIGEEITIRLLQPDGTYRPWHGLVFQVTHLGSDGGVARYRLLVRPWLGLLALRRDSFIWQEKTAIEVLDDVFNDYAQRNVRFDVGTTLPTRRLCTQYLESDLAFVTRLLAEEGLSYWFEHASDVPAQASDAPAPVGSAAPTAAVGPPADAPRHARHQLVIGDRSATRPHLGAVRFTGQHVTANLEGQRDSVTAFQALRQTATQAVTLAAWSGRVVSGIAGQAAGPHDSDAPVFEFYDGSGADRYEDAEHASRAAELMLASLAQDATTYEGAGSARHFATGCRFTLTDHAAFGPLGQHRPGTARDASGAGGTDEFTLTRVEHHASNNLGLDIAEALRLTDLESGTYRNRFRAVPASASLVPSFHRKPTAPGVQVAVVVGHEDADSTTDRDHRIHIQFPWQRGTRPLAGGLGHNSLGDHTGNAPGNAGSGAPVRVALPMAGNDWGATLVPRNGTEVAVAAVDGDIDHWIVIGQLYNAQDLPPYPAGEASGANHPGVISGFRTRQLGGSGANEWVLDDATGQLRMRLATTAYRSELALGYLIQQGFGHADRLGWLGTGFSVNTAGWASLRAGNGMLLTTSPREGTYGSAASTQMDASEALQQIRAAQASGRRLGQTASAGTGLGLAAFDDGSAVHEFIDALDPARAGKHPGDVNGQVARKAAGRESGSPVEAMATSMILLDATSAASFLSDASIASFTGQTLTLSSQGDMHAAASRTYAAVSGGTTSLHVQAGGAKVIAADGPVSVRAHGDALQILADQDASVVSVNGQIAIQAKSRIELVAGTSSVVLEGSDITFTTLGTFAVKHSNHALLGAASVAPDPLRLPDDHA